MIGVPVKSKTMDGLDSLLSIAQMPPGIPVATVAINGAKNAGLLAVKILAVADESLSTKLADYAKDLDQSVLDKAASLEAKGYKEYLNGQN